MQAIDSTAKQKIASELMGATNIFNFTVKPISHTSFRFSIWGLGEKDDLDNLKETIKEGMPEWLATLDRYDDLSVEALIPR